MSVTYADGVWGPPDDVAQMLEAAVMPVRCLSGVSGTRAARMGFLSNTPRVSRLRR